MRALLPLALHRPMAPKEKLLPQLQLHNLSIKDSKMVQQMQKITPLPPTLSPTLFHVWKAGLGAHLLGVLQDLRCPIAADRNQMIFYAVTIIFAL